MSAGEIGFFGPISPSERVFHSADRMTRHILFWGKIAASFDSRRLMGEKHKKDKRAG